MSDAIQKLINAATDLFDADRAEAWRYPTVWEPVVDRLLQACQALQSGEPVVFTCHGNNAPAYGCNTPGDMSGTYYKSPQPPTTKPIAAIKGWFHGECVIQALDPAAVLPAGMALYATPQPVVPSQWRVVMRGMVEYAECNDPGNPYLPQAQALLSAGKGTV